jgi:hypothetical protein
LVVDGVGVDGVLEVGLATGVAAVDVEEESALAVFFAGDFSEGRLSFL